MATFTVPSQAYTTGAHPFGPFPIGSGFTRLTLELTAADWPDSAGVEIISIEAVASFDSGASWSGVLGVNPSFQAGWPGGVVVTPDKFGQPVLARRYSTPIVTPCSLKGQVVLQQPLTTPITIILT